MSGLIPSEFGVNVSGNAESPVPIQIAIGDKLFLALVALVVAILITGLKR